MYVFVLLADIPLFQYCLLLEFAVVKADPLRHHVTLFSSAMRRYAYVMVMFMLSAVNTTTIHAVLAKQITMLNINSWTIFINADSPAPKIK